MNQPASLGNPTSDKGITLSSSAGNRTPTYSTIWVIGEDAWEERNSHLGHQKARDNSRFLYAEVPCWYPDFARHLGSSSRRRLLSGLGLLLSRLGGVALLLLGLSSALGVTALGRSPEGKVIAEKLHDEGAVAVGLLGERVELSNGVVEGLLGKVASTVGRVEDLVVEDGEVQSETQANGVSRGQLSLGDVGSALLETALVYGRWHRKSSGVQRNAGRQNAEPHFKPIEASYLVGVVGGSGSTLALLAGSELGEVTVVVTLPISASNVSPVLLQYSDSLDPKAGIRSCCGRYR